jgi:uncharacterized protein YndB with AHSA1/START domain
MTVKNVEKDTERLTMTLTAEFDATVDRVWQLLEDPRLLERWWGPPGYPATFVDHDLSRGGVVTYYMTGPDGDRHHGWWRITDLDPGSRVEFEDGFGEDAESPTPNMPTITASIALDAIDDSVTRMTVHSTFPSLEAMEQIVAMGMEEGLTLAVGQIDDLLAEHSMS